MEGLEIILLIALGIAALSTVAGIWLKRRRRDRLVGRMFGLLFILSLAIFLISLFIGGWEGMGYGFIAISVFVGSFIGLMVTALFNPKKHIQG